ncbi:MAG: hypothetical protein ABI741_15980 [Ferruginibacter sp.]
MKNLIIFGLFVIAMVMVQFAQAQTVDEIVDKYIAALGGKEKLMALKTIKMEGSLSTQGIDITLTSTRSHGIGMRVDFEAMGSSNYRVANTTKGAVFTPIMGMASPEDMPDDQFKSAINQMDLQGAFVNYKEKGTTIVLVGKETVEGSEAYNLKVTFKNGIVTNYYIDAKNSRIVKTTGKQNMNGQEMDVSTTYSDYKQNADGYWFPYSTTNMQGTIVYDKIQTNIPVDESIYKN